MDTKPEKVTGSCLCGEVRFEVSGSSFWRAGCCCTSCTKAAGAPAMVWTGFKRDQFKLLNGKPKLYESSPGVLRGFCERCGTTLTYERQPAKGAEVNARPDELYVSSISLDDPAAYPPDEYVWYGERAAWFHLGGDITRHEGLSSTQSSRQRLGSE